jgi:hypothetical protein
MIEMPNRDWSGVLDGDIQLDFNQAEFLYTDYPCSLPETTVDLSQQASMLAYADAIITVNSYVWMIVVWELSDEHGADHTTPVIVLHPYLDYLLAPVAGQKNEWNQYLPTFNFPGESEQVDTEFEQRTGYGFQSYLLYDTSQGSDTERITPDPWLVANIARDVVSGRYQLQFFKRGLAYEDWFFSSSYNYVLHDKGSLSKTRFPLWREAILSLQNGHSGYSIDAQGKLRGQPQALSRRILNGVTNMAQQRRMFIRRDWGIGAVVREWHITAKKFLAWMWFNDQYGFQRPSFVLGWNDPGVESHWLTATEVPWEYLKDNLQWVIDWLNLVNVAQGDNGLVMTLPGTTTAEAEQQYISVLDKLRDPDGVVSRYAVRSLGPNQAIFRHMVDLTAGIIEKIMQYRADVAAWQASPPGDTTEAQIERANVYVTIANDFALAWPGLVADVYSVFCLHCTWHLTLNLAEPTRGVGAGDVLRSKKHPYVQKWLQPRFHDTKQEFHLQVSNASDFAIRRPHFVPYRGWDIQLYDSGFDQALADEQAQERQTASDAWLQQQAQLKSQREQARAVQRADERSGAPNPDDPWDFRNYLSLAWWKQKSQEPLNLEFTLRALDAPNELLTWSSAQLGLARNLLPAASDYSDANGWNEHHIPAGTPISAIGLPIIKVLAWDVVSGINGALPYAIVGDVAAVIADYAGTNDETYSPRQFWPPLSFTW